MATKTKTLTLNILNNEGVFEISSNDVLDVKAGENIGFTVNVVWTGTGFPAPVTFQLTNLPAGVTAAWLGGKNVLNPGDPNLQCDVQIPLNAALVGTHQIDLVGTTP